MILIELFLTFMKIGAFTFGGGYAMIAMIQAEAEKHGWLSPEELIDFVALSESTPGPLAINMATFVISLIKRTISVSGGKDFLMGHIFA